MFHAKQHDPGKPDLVIVIIAIAVSRNILSCRCPVGRSRQQAIGSGKRNISEGIFFRKSLKTL